MSTKFKVTIKHITVEYHEMILEADKIMEAFDEARELTSSRNKSSHTNGQYHVIRIETHDEKG